MHSRKIDAILIAYGFMINDESFEEKHLKAIQAAAPSSEIIVARDKSDWEKKAEKSAGRVNVFFGMNPGQWQSKLSVLHWAQQLGAGADWLGQYPDFIKSDIVLTNASGVHAIPISEHILGLMFALSRKIHFSVRNQMSRQWERRGRMGEIEGSVMGLLGLGAIGSKTAEKAKALGMKVLGLRRNPDQPDPHVDEMFGPDRLNDLLAGSDWVVITVAATPETNGMIGEAQLKAMKPSAHIINIARGKVIAENELIRALTEKRIAGAGLDVFEQEPLPEDSPLWEMKNVIITPHQAGSTPYYMDRLVDIFTQNLLRYQAGEPLINVVDKRLGY